MDKKVLLWNGPTLVKVEREEVNQFLHEEVQKYGQKTYLFRKNLTPKYRQVSRPQTKIRVQSFRRNF